MAALFQVHNSNVNLITGYGVVKLQNLLQVYIYLHYYAYIKHYLLSLTYQNNHGHLYIIYEPYDQIVNSLLLFLTFPVGLILLSNVI